jgi:hypothetical protein
MQLLLKRQLFSNGYVVTTPTIFKDSRKPLAEKVG